MQYALNYSSTRVLSTEIKITQCPGEFRLNDFENFKEIMDETQNK